jgi:DNA modification methylase
MGDLSPTLDIPRNQHLLIISKNQSWLTHGFHKYPAKFFPELPRWAILKYSAPEEVVLDPMAGSGTMNVEALLNRRHSIAVDVDPFACLLTRVKTTPLDPARLRRAHAAVVDVLDALSAGGDGGREAAMAHVPAFAYRETWFRPFILQELGQIRQALGHVARAAGGPQTDAYVDFFRVCLSSIIREVSNADNNCTRTVVRTRLNKRIVPGMALRLFRKVAQVNVERMVDFAARCPGGVSVQIPENADARRLPLGDAYADLAVTSPPYINAVDYPRTHQLEMYLLDLTPPGQPLAEAKRQHIGTEVVRAADYRRLHTYGHAPLDRQIEDLHAVDPRRAFIVYQYFADMERNFREVHRVLKPGRRYVVVVGNNVIRGREVPTHEYLMAVAGRVGLDLETFFASEVIRHYIKVPRKERISRDWVLVFRT